jgi:molybdate transport system ATP-binding protein
MMGIGIEIALSGPRSRDFALDLRLSLPMRGVTAVLGPSGSGKTSLLRALAGLDRHRGTLRFGNVVWQDETRFLPAHRRGVGMIFQGSGLLPHLSVADNLRYAQRRAPAGPFGRDDVIARTGIAALLDRSPARLSGGEAQRAAIARALLAQPRLLLMDEPLSALDQPGRAALLTTLEALFARVAIPVVYVTHAPPEAERLAGRIVTLDGGRVRAITPGHPD